MTRNYDAILIGIGPSAPAHREDLGAQGMEVALISSERDTSPATHYDSVSARGLVASTRTLFVAKRAAGFGIRIPGPPEVDFPRVTARLKELQQQSRHCRNTWISRMNNVQLLAGEARFRRPQFRASTGMKWCTKSSSLCTPERHLAQSAHIRTTVSALLPSTLHNLVPLN